MDRARAISCLESSRMRGDAGNGVAGQKKKKRNLGASALVLAATLSIGGCGFLSSKPRMLRTKPISCAFIEVDGLPCKEVAPQQRATLSWLEVEYLHEVSSSIDREDGVVQARLD